MPFDATLKRVASERRITEWSQYHWFESGKLNRQCESNGDLECTGGILDTCSREGLSGASNSHATG